jgi:hypothetical protein
MVEVETLYDVEENIDDDNVHEGSARSIGMPLQLLAFFVD